MTDEEIARAARLESIGTIAARAGIPEDALHPYGRTKAKVDASAIPDLPRRPQGKLVLVAGINPTPAGEGKTTTTIGLADAFRRIGRSAIACLREPSLGPCFGVKGGATGGGRAQIVPMDQINLHFTGDFHAVTTANNLLAALIDNHLHHGNALGLDPRRISWRRCVDLNDRALRAVVTGLDGNGPVREGGFDITVASEVMAVLCLARDLDDLRGRLARMIVGTRRDGGAVTAGDLKADGAMAALLRDAMLPNLVQTLEGTPALVHGGPFANIAHGCNSVAATTLALRLGEVVVTEAGFGADLGGEKFCDIKCRSAGLSPAACVVVASVRALKMHGGVARAELGREDLAALRRGIANVARHVENMAQFGLPAVVAINRFPTDTDAELALVADAMAALGTEAIGCTHWAEGGAGAVPLAQVVARRFDPAADFRLLYPDAMPLEQKLRTIAQRIYRAADIAVSPAVARRLAAWQAGGFGHLPVCVAKTQYSFSADPTLLGAPEGHVLPVREARLSAGAGFIVAICGDVMTMPGLPKSPAAERVGLDAGGAITGLF